MPFLSEQYLLRRFTILAGESVAAVFHEGLFEGSIYSMHVHVQHVVRCAVIRTILPEGREWTADCSAKLKAPILHSCKYVRSRQCGKKRQTVCESCTGISSQIRTKLRDWAIWQARAGCYSQAALSSNDSKTLYITKEHS